MKRTLPCFAVVLIFMAGLFPARAQPSNPVATMPAPASDFSHVTEPLRDGIIAWDGLSKSADITNGQNFARFTFPFTNVSAGSVTILSVHSSCGCTTAELPPVPWTLPAGANGVVRTSPA